MKSIVLLCSLTTSAILAAEPEQKSASNESLIMSLADRDFKLRESATSQLKLRTSAYSAVRRAAESADPEVARRATEILAALAKLVAAERLPQLSRFSKENIADCFMEALIEFPDQQSLLPWQKLLDHGHLAIDDAARAWKIDLRPSHVTPEKQYKDLARKHRLAMVFAPEDIRDVQGKVLYRGPACRFDRLGQSLLTVCSGDLITPSSIGFGYSLGNIQLTSWKIPEEETYCILVYGVAISDGNINFANDQLPKGASDERLAGPAILVAHGNVVLPHQCSSCVILAGGTVTFPDNCQFGGVVRCGGKAIYNGKLHKHSKLDIVENDPKALEPFKFFDVAMLGLTAKPGTEKALAVTEVDAKSDLAKAGLAKGDVFLQVDGKPAKTADDLRKLLRSGYVRGEAKLTIRRGAETKELAAVFPLPTK